MDALDEDDPLDAFMADVGAAVKQDLQGLDPDVARAAVDANGENPVLTAAGISLPNEASVKADPDTAMKTEEDEAVTGAAGAAAAATQIGATAPGPAPEVVEAPGLSVAIKDEPGDVKPVMGGVRPSFADCAAESARFAHSFARAVSWKIIRNETRNPAA
jgi:hypothetical protein